MMMDGFSDLQIFARTLYGEARGEVKKYGVESLMAVAHVVMNRVSMGLRMLGMFA